MILQYTITKEDAGKPILHILKNRMKLSNKLIIRLKRLETGIQKNGERVFTNALVSPEDVITVCMHFPEQASTILPEPLTLEILYEDACLIALQKPSGQVVHPTHNYQSGTLSNGLAHYYKCQGISSAVRPVSRLDRGTSGIVLFAKNPHVQERLSGRKADLDFKKYYIALVHKSFQPEQGVIQMPIARLPGSTIERFVSNSGSRAVTHYKTIKNWQDYSLMQFQLETGRTHQIRVHCKYSGHPIVGDTLYDLPEYSNTLGLSHQALHACRVTFLHPLTAQTVDITAPLPQDFQQSLKELD